MGSSWGALLNKMQFQTWIFSFGVLNLPLDGMIDVDSGYLRLSDIKCKQWIFEKKYKMEKDAWYMYRIRHSL